MTLAEAQAQLTAWQNASLKLARGQVARVADQRLDRADWDQVQKAIAYWQGIVNQLSTGSALGVKYAAFPRGRI